MIGKASEIKTKRIVRTPIYSFNLDDHRNAKSLNEMLDEWLQKYPDYMIHSISFLTHDKDEIALIIYKEPIKEDVIKCNHS